jgi:hypothetical protein
MAAEPRRVTLRSGGQRIGSSGAERSSSGSSGEGVGVQHAAAGPALVGFGDLRGSRRSGILGRRAEPGSGAPHCGSPRRSGQAAEAGLAHGASGCRRRHGLSLGAARSRHGARHRSRRSAAGGGAAHVRDDVNGRADGCRPCRDSGLLEPADAGDGGPGMLSEHSEGVTHRLSAPEFRR